MVDDGDPLVDEQISESLGSAGGVEVDHDQRASVDQRPPHLPDREIERVGMEHRPDVVRTETEGGLRVREQTQHVLMGDGHPLGSAGGSGGVDHVGNVLRRQRRTPVRIRQRASTCAEKIDCVRVEHRDTTEIDVQPGRDGDDRLCVVDHELDSVGRVRGGDGQVAGSGGRDSQKGHHQLDRPRKRDRYQGFRTGAECNQLVGKCTDSPRDLVVGPRSPIPSHRGAIR